MGSLKMKPSCSQIFRRLECQFENDTDQLAKSIMADKQKGTCLSDGPIFSFKKASPASPQRKGAHARNCSTAKKLMDLKNDSDTCRRKSSVGNLPMSQQKFQEVIHGWKKQNRELEMEIGKFRNLKESNKSQLKVKSDEIFCLGSQNSKLEDLLKKCEEQIKKLIATENARNENKCLAESLNAKLFNYQSQVTDLEIKLKNINKELSETKSERNQLMIETYNLRRDNKQLESQLCNKNADKNKTSQEFLKLQSLLDNTDGAIESSLQYEIEPREAPSAMTALDILKTNHQNEFSKLKNKIGDMKAKEVYDQIKIKKLKTAINHLIVN